MEDRNFLAGDVFSPAKFYQIFKLVKSWLVLHYFNN